MSPRYAGPGVDDLIAFLEWLDCEREVIEWGDPNGTPEKTALRYLEETR